MAISICRKYIDHEGFCELVWIGRVAAVPGPKQNIVFRAYFLEIDFPEGKPKAIKRLKGTFVRNMPVGDVIDTPLGTIFQNGIPIHQPVDSALKANTASLVLNFSKDNVQIQERRATVNNAADGKLILSTARPHLLEDAEFDGALIYIGDGTNPLAYAIPCFEVFRFFYAVSSTMAQVFLDSRFIKWNQYVWNPHKSVIDKSTREAKLWLRQWMLDNDAWFIASLAFDEDAVERGKDLFRSIAVEERRILRAVPPMSEQINVVAEWRPNMNGLGTQTKVITRLISTDWRPPFDVLTYDRDNDARGTKDKNAESVASKTINRKSTQAPRRPRNPDEHLNLNAAGTDPNKTPEEIQAEEINSRFTWFKQARIKKMPQLETKYRREKTEEEQEKQWDKELSTFHGQSSANALRRVNITSVDQKCIDETKKRDDANQEKAGEESPVAPHAELLTLAKRLSELGALQLAKVEFLPLWGKVYRDESFILYQLPRTIDGERYPWCCNSETKMPRMALAVKIVQTVGQSIKTRFLLDFEPGPKQSSMVIVSAEGGRDPTIDDLCSIVSAFAQVRSVKKTAKVLGLANRGANLKIGHRVHSVTANTEPAADFLERIFSTPMKGPEDEQGANDESEN